MSVSLTDYPGVPVLTKSFLVTITCVVSTITFSTPPSLSTTLQVGIDTQPKDIAFATSQTPKCLKTVTFTNSTAVAFLSLTSPTTTAGNVRISGATINNDGTYVQTLTATVDGKTSTASYTVIIKDPCSTATFETNPAGLVTMIMNMPRSAALTQMIIIKTDVEINYPTIMCPFAVWTTLTPLALYISSAANIITIDATQILLPTDLGTHTFTMIVDS